MRIPKIIDVAEEVRRMGSSVSDSGRTYPLQVEWPQVTKVAISGQMHSGKSSVSSVLASNGYVKLAFAAELKDISVSLLNSIAIQVHRRTGGKWKDITREEADKNKAMLRPLWQFIGAYGRQQYGDDVWVKVFEDRYSPEFSRIGLKMVLDDLRYINEAEYLRKKGWTIFKIERDEKDRRESVRAAFERTHGRAMKKRELKDEMGHESEAEVNDIAPDHLILNNGSLADLRRVMGKLTGGSHLKSSYPSRY